MSLLARVNDLVRKGKQELGKTTLGCGIIAKNATEGGVAKGFREALTESLSCASVVAESVGVC